MAEQSLFKKILSIILIIAMIVLGAFAVFNIIHIMKHMFGMLPEHEEEPLEGYIIATITFILGVVICYIIERKFCRAAE